MLEPLTHPFACLVYFVALGAGLHRLLGDPRSTLGFLGRSMLFATGSLGVSAAAVLSWSYGMHAPPEAFLGRLLIIPVVVLLLSFVGTLVAAMTIRPRLIFPLTLGAMSAVLFMALLELCPY